MKKQPVLIMFVFPVMLYYLMEALLVSLFIRTIANLLLFNIVGDVTYLQWVGIYWIFKMLFFDVFKMMTSNPPPENEEE